MRGQCWADCLDSAWRNKNVLDHLCRARLHAGAEVVEIVDGAENNYELWPLKNTARHRTRGQVALLIHLIGTFPYMLLGGG